MILHQFSQFFFFLIVGLDIQQKLNVHYSGAQSFGTETSYCMSDDGRGMRPQESDHQPKNQGQYTASAPDQGTTQSLTSEKAEI